MSNDQWGLKPIQSPRGNSLTDFFRPNEECPRYTTNRAVFGVYGKLKTKISI